jgi:hypothetical protein
MNDLLVSTVASTMNINHEAKLNPRADTEPKIKTASLAASTPTNVVLSFV